MYGYERDSERIDLTDGIRIARSLIQSSLEGSTGPFLTSSRLLDNFRLIKQRLMASVSELSADDLAALFPVLLVLRGYEVVGDSTHTGRHFWEIRFSDPGGIYHTGMGALVERSSDARIYRELMKELNYGFGMFYLSETVSPPTDSVSDRVKVMDQDDLIVPLVALAIAEYMDTFAHSIVSIYGLRERVHAAVTQVTGLSQETIVATARRWTVVAGNQQT